MCRLRRGAHGCFYPLEQETHDRSAALSSSLGPAETTNVVSQRSSCQHSAGNRRCEGCEAHAVHRSCSWAPCPRVRGSSPKARADDGRCRRCVPPSRRGAFPGAACGALPPARPRPAPGGREKEEEEEEEEEGKGRARLIVPRPRSALGPARSSHRSRPPPRPARAAPPVPPAAARSRSQFGACVLPWRQSQRSPSGASGNNCWSLCSSPLGGREVGREGRREGEREGGRDRGRKKRDPRRSAPSHTPQHTHQTRARRCRRAVPAAAAEDGQRLSGSAPPGERRRGRAGAAERGWGRREGARGVRLSDIRR